MFIYSIRTSQYLVYFHTVLQRAVGVERSSNISTVQQLEWTSLVGQHLVTDYEALDSVMDKLQKVVFVSLQLH